MQDDDSVDTQNSFKLDDLAQENKVLRNELFNNCNLIARLYNEKDGDKKQMQTLEHRILYLENELKYSKSLETEKNVIVTEQKAKIKELQEKVNSLNLDIVQSLPLQIKIKELTSIRDKQTHTIDQISKEYVNLTHAHNLYKTKLESTENEFNHIRNTMTRENAQLRKDNETLQRDKESKSPTIY